MVNLRKKIVKGKGNSKNSKNSNLWTFSKNLDQDQHQSFLESVISRAEIKEERRRRKSSHNDSRSHNKSGNLSAMVKSGSYSDIDQNLSLPNVEIKAGNLSKISKNSESFFNFPVGFSSLYLVTSNGFMGIFFLILSNFD